MDALIKPTTKEWLIMVKFASISNRKVAMGFSGEPTITAP